MGEKDPDRVFLEILEGSFPANEIPKLDELPRSPKPRQVEVPVNEDRAELIYQASRDPRIADVVFSGYGSRQELVNWLQSEYPGLTEEEAQGIIVDVEYKLREVADYGDEA